MKCAECARKDRVIETLQKTCAGYEARIKRFQTLSKNRRRRNAPGPTTWNMRKDERAKVFSKTRLEPENAGIKPDFVREKAVLRILKRINKLTRPARKKRKPE